MEVLLVVALNLAFGALLVQLHKGNGIKIKEMNLVIIRRKVVLVAVFIILIVGVVEFVSKANILQDEKMAKRPETKITLKLDEDEADIVFPSVPYVSEEGIISILPAETIFVEFDISNGKLITPKYSKENKSKNKVLQLSMTQDKEGTILQLSHKFSKAIIADCFIQCYGENKLKKSNILPVQPNIVGYESWENKVCFILLRNVRFEE